MTLDAPLRVVAGAILDPKRDRVLLSYRDAARQQGDCWEYPGGKCEAGEDSLSALRRELCEELGLQVLGATPFHQVEHDYGTHRVSLRFLAVTDWAGEPHGREGQRIAWFDLDQLDALPFPAANRGVATALRRWLSASAWQPV